MQRLDRSVSRISRLTDDPDDGYVEATPTERLAQVLEITVALWSIATKGEVNAQSRLQKMLQLFEKHQGSYIIVDAYASAKLERLVGKLA
jgi:hypothetical protein